MTFTKRLREGIRSGEITCSVRIWTRPRVALPKSPASMTQSSLCWLRSLITFNWRLPVDALSGAMHGPVRTFALKSYRHEEAQSQTELERWEACQDSHSCGKVC